MVGKGNRMRNPYEQTGRSGRGVLWFDGPNKAADALILVAIRGVQHMAVVRRDSGHWAMPGGFVGPEEGPRAAAFRELAEEAGVVVGPRSVEHARLVYEGYVRDPRNTDDSWIETSVYCLDLGDSEAPPLRAGDDARDVTYLEVTDGNIRDLYPGHAMIVRQILDARGAGTCEDCFNSMVEDFALDSPEATSVVSRILNAVIVYGMDRDHANPNVAIRLGVLFGILTRASRLVEEEFVGRLSPSDLAVVEGRIGQFLARTPPSRANVAAAIDKLTSKPRFDFKATIVSPNPGSIN